MLVEYVHEVCGRLLIQPTGPGGGPAAVMAELAAQPGKRLDVPGRGGADLERMARAPPGR